MSGSGEHRNYGERPDEIFGPEPVAGQFKEAPSSFLHDGGLYDIKTAGKSADETGELHERGYLRIDESQSARVTASWPQVFFFLALALVTTGLFILSPVAAIIALSALFSGFYICVIVFRAAVLAEFRPPHRPVLSAVEVPGGKSYAILVALYREAGQVKDLIKALDRLRWHAGRKSIHLICEEDDSETIAAIKSLGRADIGLFVVPQGVPRTKPRALNFALQQVTSDYLVLYDAEDRPHPDQLMEAAARFTSGPEELACLQAPLIIDNRGESLLTRCFAVEYDTLFLGILPAITLWRSPVPLGGTSNHFKTDQLKEIGGWDSFNVTEDADLGIRLARHRKTCETLFFPTYEEAPATHRPWLRQRTRWIKGWLQTLLVHLRNPVKTAKEMGFAKFLQFQMVLTSVVVSVLVHPFFLVAFIFQMMNLYNGAFKGVYDLTITGVSAFNLTAGYLTYGLLAYAVQGIRGSVADRLIILFFPIYWLLISIAGWRAVFQLLLRPHHWEKTVHGSARRKTPQFPD